MVVFVQKAWFWLCFGVVFLPPPPPYFWFGLGALVFGSFCSTTLPPPVNKICFGEETPPPRSLLTQVTPSRITSSNES